MSKELEEFWNEDVEGSVEGIRVELVRAILTDLLKCIEGALKDTQNDTNKVCHIK